MLNRLINIIAFLLCIDIVLDPGNSIFKLKEILFILTLVLGLLYCTQNKSSYNHSVVLACLFFGLLLPIYGLCIGFIRNQYFDISYATMYVKSFLFIWLLLIQKANIPWAKYLALTSLFIIVPCIYCYLTIKNFDQNATYYLVEKNAAFISKRMFAGVLVDPVIYYKTSSLSIFGIAWLLFTPTKNQKTKIIRALLLFCILFVVAISYSRAILLSVGIILLIYLFKKFKHHKLFKPIIYSIIILGLIFTSPIIFSKILFAPGEEGNTIKLGHLFSYLYLFKEDPLTLIIGQGLGAGFYSSGFGEITHMAELSYLELIRFFGLFGFLIIILFLIYPLIYYFKNKPNITNEYMYIAYALYLFCAGTNPLLISSTGMIVLVSIYSVILNKNNKYEKP